MYLGRVPEYKYRRDEGDSERDHSRYQSTHTSAGYPRMSVEEMKETVREITSGIRTHIPQLGIPG